MSFVRSAETMCFSDFSDSDHSLTAQVGHDRGGPLHKSAIFVGAISLGSLGTTVLVKRYSETIFGHLERIRKCSLAPNMCKMACVLFPGLPCWVVTE